MGLRGGAGRRGGRGKRGEVKEEEDKGELEETTP